MTEELVPFDLTAGIIRFLATFGFLGGLILIISAIASRFIVGPGGPKMVFGQVKEGLQELFSLKCRRVWAVSLLTIKEAIRRKILLVFVLFAVLFMFADWFLAKQEQHLDFQIEVYVTFVLTVIPFLTIPIVLLMSCWGIPEDIRLRSLHTVVTKPARRLEIVIGRIIGFICVSTILLFFMGVIGYIWIQRTLPTAARDALVCRVPVYGELNFLDNTGNPAAKGVNVGDIWDYRSYIAGASKARAIWSFTDIDPRILEGDSFLIESRFEAFRTTKGTIGEEVGIELTLVNPETGVRIRRPSFTIQEFKNNLVEIPFKVSVYDEELDKTVDRDVREEILNAERFEVEIRCLDASQYLGMATPDLFIRLPDNSFLVGYIKALFGQWLLLVLIVSISVALSCMVKGPVAMMSTCAILIIGVLFSGTLEEQVTGQALGGGPMESIFRILSHYNEKQPIAPDDLVGQAAIGLDEYFLTELLRGVNQLLPDISTYDMSGFVAKGFDVSTVSAIYPSLAITLAYFCASILWGYYSLKLRELESK